MRLSHLIACLSCGLLAADPMPDDSRIGAKPPEGAKVLFDGASAVGKNLDAWVKRDGTAPVAWKVEGDRFAVAAGTGDIASKEKFGDFQLHLEFNVPYMPKATGQARGNSGVYLGGAYELQILDSFGLKLQDNDCGAIYKQAIPKVNACKPPLQWQTYDVTFRAAKLEGGKVVSKARVTVIQNGLTIHEDLEISPSPGGSGNAEGEPGPLLLQDHGNDVQFRNIWISPLK